MTKRVFWIAYLVSSFESLEKTGYFEVNKLVNRARFLPGVEMSNPKYPFVG